jgi:hypothetical protein
LRRCRSRRTRGRFDRPRPGTRLRQRELDAHWWASSPVGSKPLHAVAGAHARNHPRRAAHQRRVGDSLPAVGDPHGRPPVPGRGRGHQRCCLVATLPPARHRSPLVGHIVQHAGTGMADYALPPPMTFTPRSSPVTLDLGSDILQWDPTPSTSVRIPCQEAASPISRPSRAANGTIRGRKPKQCESVKRPRVSRDSSAQHNASSAISAGLPLSRNIVANHGNHDGYAMPSYEAPVAMVLLEAMAAGKLVVALANGGALKCRRCPVRPSALRQ